MYPNRWVFSVAVHCSVQVSPSARMFHGLFLMAEVAQCSVPMLTGPYRLYAMYILFTSIHNNLLWLCLPSLRSLCASLVFLHWRERGLELVRLFLSFSAMQPGCGSLGMCVKPGTDPVWSTIDGAKLTPLLWQLGAICWYWFSTTGRSW